MHAHGSQTCQQYQTHGPARSKRGRPMHTSSLLCCARVATVICRRVGRVRAPFRASSGRGRRLGPLTLPSCLLTELFVTVALVLVALSVLVIFLGRLLAALQVVHVRDVVAASALPVVVVRLLALLPVACTPDMRTSLTPHAPCSNLATDECKWNARL